MKERPIIFNGDMVRAILDGRKTQTRRPVKPQPVPYTSQAKHSDHAGMPWMPIGGVDKSKWRCPFGAPGDRLWVRETWACPQTVTYYRADEESLLPPGAKWTPSIHMPRWASRITLEVTAVRVERVQDITEEDAESEGVDVRRLCGCQDGCAHCDDRSPKEVFRDLWQSIYANWPANPWVWAVEFRRIQP